MAEPKTHRARCVNVHSGGMRAAPCSHETHDTGPEDGRARWIDDADGEVDHGGASRGCVLPEVEPAHG